jgi:hypothetical protein
VADHGRHYAPFTIDGTIDYAPFMTEPRRRRPATPEEAKALGHPLSGDGAETRFAPIETFQEELRAAGPESVAGHEKFLLHLSPDEVEELDRRILAVLDEYLVTDRERLDRPAVGGIFVLHHRKPGDAAGG